MSLKLETIEMHTGGEPLRIVVEGVPEILGDTILEKYSYVKAELDHIRRFLIFEPRGHYDMYGALPVKTDIPEAHAAFLFMDNKGYSTMCGHAVIALGRYCIDQGIVKYQEPETQVNIQCPCGLVKAYVACSGGKTRNVRFTSVPAFVLQTNVEIEIPQYGAIKVNVSFGGGFYAFVDAQTLGMDISSTKLSQILEIAKAVKEMVQKKVKIYHPNDEKLAFLYGVIFTNDERKDNIRETLCIFADSQVDRSPCGSGVTAKMALLYHKGQVAKCSHCTFENAKTKSRFSAQIVEETQCGHFKAVTVEVAGEAFYKGRSTFTSEEEDSFNKGFLLK